jgi:3-hydroxyisobutyrate dehydrogenase
MLRTGFVGLGAMGAPMALNLHAAGLLAAVWNRTPEKAVDIADQTGCHPCESLEELARRCDAVVICVSADPDVLDIVERLATSLSPRSVVIDCSTISAATAREAADTLAGYDLQFLDCPVSGGTEGAQQGSLSIMVGGEAAALQKARPVLEAMGRAIVYMGGPGAGQATKATNQIMVAGINQAVTEALAFGRSQGLPMEQLIEALSGGAAANWFLTHRGPTMVDGRFPLGFKVGLHQKDLDICADMAADSGARLPLIEMTRLHYRRLLERGLGDQDISSLFLLKEELFEPDDN